MYMLQNTAKAKQEAIHALHVHFIHEKKNDMYVHS